MIVFPLSFVELKKFLIFFVKSICCFSKEIHSQATSFGEKIIYRRSRALSTLTCIFLSPSVEHRANEQLSSFQNVSFLCALRTFYWFWEFGHQYPEVPLCIACWIRHCGSQTSRKWLSILGDSKHKTLRFLSISTSSALTSVVQL